MMQKKYYFHYDFSCKKSGTFITIGMRKNFFLNTDRTDIPFLFKISKTCNIIFSYLGNMY
jgi:hypothetical protein